MDSSLEKEFDFYIKNQKDLVSKYEGKVIVIKDQEVIGIYDSELEAVQKTSSKHTLGTFLVQRCTSGKDGLTQTYHSRVAFQAC